MAKHLENELEHLKKNLLSLTLVVEEIVQNSIDALKDKNKAKAKAVIQLDNVVDQREVEVEEDCLKILALHQPVATDLRYIIGVLKMNNDLERIGDLAVNIAERTIYIIKGENVDPPIDITEMGTKTLEMLRLSIDALINMNSDMAKQVIQMDDTIDEMHGEMYQVIFNAIKNDPEKVSSYSNYLSASKNLERIADYTTNIAEDVIYMIDGIIIRHRPDID